MNKKFLELLDELVNQEGHWQDKLDKLLEAANDRDNHNIAEFISWFELNEQDCEIPF